METKLLAHHNKQSKKTTHENEQEKNHFTGFEPYFECKDKKIKVLRSYSPGNLDEMMSNNLFKQIANLRHKMLIQRRGWRVDNRGIKGIDVDSYDLAEEKGQDAQHFVATDDQNRVTGYVRIIEGNDQGKETYMIDQDGPFAKMMPENIKDIIDSRRANSLEVSRLIDPRIKYNKEGKLRIIGDINPGTTNALYASYTRHAIDKGIENFFMITDSIYFKNLKKTFTNSQLGELGEYIFQGGADYYFNPCSEEDLEDIFLADEESEHILLKKRLLDLSMGSMINLNSAFRKIIKDRNEKYAKLFFQGMPREKIYKYLINDLEEGNELLSPEEILKLPSSIQDKVIRDTQEIKAKYNKLSEEDLEWVNKYA